MKERKITTKNDLAKACVDLAHLEDHLPFVLTVTLGNNIRTEGQNSRYWAILTEDLSAMNQTIAQIEEHGYTNIEARNEIAKRLPSHQAAILYCANVKTVHDIIKIICGVPTSTRLGTKKFKEFEEIMLQTLAEIIGEIKSVGREAES